MRVPDWVVLAAARASVAARRGRKTAKGYLGVASISYGSWLVFHPAAFIVAGVLLLADRITD